jgi:hypothetical protein
MNYSLLQKKDPVLATRCPLIIKFSILVGRNWHCFWHCYMQSLQEVLFLPLGSLGLGWSALLSTLIRTLWNTQDLFSYPGLICYTLVTSFSWTHSSVSLIQGLYCALLCSAVCSTAWSHSPGSNIPQSYGSLFPFPLPLDHCASSPDARQLENHCLIHILCTFFFCFGPDFKSSLYYFILVESITSSWFFF